MRGSEQLLKKQDATTYVHESVLLRLRAILVFRVGLLW